MGMDPMKTKPPIKNPARCANCRKKGPTMLVTAKRRVGGLKEILVCVACARRW